MTLYSTTSSNPFEEQTAAALHGNIFRPPLTPGMSYGDAVTYAATPSQDRPSLTRKRTRAHSNKANTSAPLSYASKDNWNLRPTSPAPLANEHYTLDYKFDTPTLAAAARDDDDLAGERDFRWRWDAGNPSPDQNTSPGLLARERNGKGRTISYVSVSEPPQTSGWGHFVMSLVGGVAEKMWHFCRQSAFSGFNAGSGQPFEFAQPTRLPTPLPGQYPDTDFFGDFEQDNTPIRSLKRQHTENGWVMVDHNPDTPRPAVRKISSGNLTTLGATRASSRRVLSSVTRRIPSRQTSYTGSPQAQSRLDIFDQAFAECAPSTASTASTRSAAPARPKAPVHHRSPVSSPKRATFSPSRPSTASGNESHLSPDAQQYLHRMEKQDKDADKSMRKMSRQVQELIRQGQAALGTKFEVEDFDFDDGDDWEDAKAGAR